MFWECIAGNIYLKIPIRQSARHELQQFSCSSWTLFNCTSGECLARDRYYSADARYRYIDAIGIGYSCTILDKINATKPPSAVCAVAFFHVLCPCRLGVNDLHLKTFSRAHCRRPVPVPFSHSALFSFCVSKTMRGGRRKVAFFGAKEIGTIKIDVNSSQFGRFMIDSALLGIQLSMPAPVLHPPSHISHPPSPHPHLKHSQWGSILVSRCVLLLRFCLFYFAQFLLGCL